MAEHVTNCLNPRFVFNKYINQKVWVDCGKCPACLERKRARWAARMQLEADCWQFAYVLYLDYNDESIPRYDFDPNNAEQLIETCPRLSTDTEPVNIYELYEKDPNEREYIIQRLNSHPLALPHPSVRDIQLFKKRLNTYIKREVTGRYKNFRSCIAAEIGETTFRPHYHGIIYFNGIDLAEKIDLLVRKAWTDTDGNALGHAKCEPPRGNAINYVSKYVCKPANLPALYSHPAFRPFFLTSRNPPIGSLLQSTTEIREIFNNCACQRVVFGKSSDNYKPRVVPLEKCVKDRLFPKIPLYSQIPSRLRSELYMIYCDDDVYDFQSFFFSVYRQTYKIDFSNRFQSVEDILKTGHSNFEPWRTNFSVAIRAMTDDFNCLHSLKELYTINKRVYWQSKSFGIPVRKYVQQVMRFHDYAFPQYQLRMFYNKEIDLLPGEDTHRVFYPETEALLGVSPVDSNEYKIYKKDVEYRAFINSRIKYKNDYLELKLIRNDSVLYNLIKNYYAKKCNEANQAESDPRS